MAAAGVQNSYLVRLQILRCNGDRAGDCAVIRSQSKDVLKPVLRQLRACGFGSNERALVAQNTRDAGMALS